MPPRKTYAITTDETTPTRPIDPAREWAASIPEVVAVAGAGSMDGEDRAPTEVRAVFFEAPDPQAVASEAVTNTAEPVTPIPSKTPQAVVDKLQKVFHETLVDPEISAKLKGLGFDIVDAGPGPFGTVIATDVARWGPIIKASGAKAN